MLEVIRTTYTGLEAMLKKPEAWKDDGSLIDLLEILHKAIFAYVHSDGADEENVRTIIRRYVIGCKDKSGIYVGGMSIIVNKIKLITASEDKSTLQAYIDLHDKYMALASFRSFKHFCIYIEKIFGMSLFQTLGGKGRALEGYFFYANQMVLDGSVKFLEKQLPTSYGKSVSDCFMIAWIFGHNINDDVLKVFGNKGNIVRCFDTIKAIMQSKEYANVFPYYKNLPQIFEKESADDGTFKITGSKKSVNLEIISKEMKRSGIRAKWLFFDDITQAEDIASITKHEKDIDTYNNVWVKRRYSSNNFFQVASGTTYSIYDILSYVKNKYGFAESVEDKKFKYTKVGKSNVILENATSVFICVPKLDYKTDKSTYPEEYGTNQARKDRDDHYEMFMAMEQQQPQRPKDNPFYFTQLQEYTSLPEKNTGGRGDSCWAYLDGKRKGSDYCAMVICTPIQGYHTVVDVIYDSRPMKECYSAIVAKVRTHHITKLVIESNINEGLKTLLEKMFKDHRIAFCDVDEVFNYIKKDVRIANSESEIRNLMRFPSFGLYANSSQIGQAMTELYSYNYRKPPEHDDFTDACAGYASYFCGSEPSIPEVSIFMR